MLGFTAPPRTMFAEESGGILPPANLSPPALSGSFFAGQTLTSSTGTWSNAPTAYEYKWQKNGSDLLDTDNSYLVTTGDDGGIIKCLVRAQNAGGWSDWVESNGVYALALALWLDASDTATISHTGGSVSQWSDKSGHAQHVVQTTGSKQPVTGSRSINSLNTIYFDGSNDALAKNPSTNFGAGNYTTFTVTLSDNASSSRWIYYKSDYFGLSVGEGGGSNPTADCAFGNTSSAIKSYGFTSAASTARIMGARRSSLSQFVFTGSTDHSAATANNVTGGQLSIGAFNNAAAWFAGIMGEIIMAQRDWSNAERNQVGSYLNGKWGVSWTNR